MPGRLNTSRAGLDDRATAFNFSDYEAPSFQPAPSPAVNGAFTLLEILVVLAIIGMLVTLAVNNVGKLFEGSRQDIAKLFVTQSMPAPLTVYKVHIGDFPTTAKSLQALITPPANKADTLWRANPPICRTGSFRSIHSRSLTSTGTRA